MIQRRMPFGSAQREVLLKLTNPRWSDGIWDEESSLVLFENKAMTRNVCQQLAAHGYLDEKVDGRYSVYTVTILGRDRANQLRGLD